MTRLFRTPPLSRSQVKILPTAALEQARAEATKLKRGSVCEMYTYAYVHK